MPCKFKHYLWAMLFSLVGCENKKEILPPVHDPIPTVLQFDQFYKTYHLDSVFQLDHIKFPIAGDPNPEDTNMYTTDFYWTKNQWQLHKPFNEQDTMFARFFNQMDSTLIIETILHKASPMRLQRRYSYDTAWSLIYYSPLRVPVKIEIN